MKTRETSIALEQIEQMLKGLVLPSTKAAWQEYDYAADWCARRGLRGGIGDRLPEGLSEKAKSFIDDDPEAFEQRVTDFAYATAMLSQEADDDSA